MKIMNNILLLILSCIIGIIFAEIIFRSFLNIKYQFSEKLPGMRINPFPGLSYDMEKCSECTIKINSLGLRGSEIQTEKPPETIRILIIGDSATFGAGVQNEEETIPGRLQKRLNDEPYLKGKRFEVINGGVPGYDIQEIYFHYKYKLKQLKSDIVIYNFFPNDFLNSRFKVEKIDGKPTLIRLVNAESPGLQILSFLPEKINIALNEYSLLYRYTLFYVSQLFSYDNYELSRYLGKFQNANIRYLYLLIGEIKNDDSIFIMSSEIYSFCAGCKEPLSGANCPYEKGCFAVYNLIKQIEKDIKGKNIPFVYLSDSVSDMDLNAVIVDNFAHYTGKANVIMADKLYEFLKPLIQQNSKFSK
ncbi:MAG: SGNH/GDSL hydrolase family protein [Deltaproteobacteria bacterium]|nr:SGNH/GDSL hydrolase family protein [Deltaproteobacteria bacterium]